MTLMGIYDLIKFIGNKDFNGNIYSPPQYQISIIAANIDYFKVKFGLPEEYQSGVASTRLQGIQPGRPVPRQYIDATQKLSDDLRKFKEFVEDQVVAAGKFSIPSDYVHCISIQYNYTPTVDGTPTILPVPVDMLTEDQWADRMGNFIKRPTIKNPIGIIRQDDIFIEPNTINAVDFHYLRLPLEPVFDYEVTNDELIYKPGTSTEFEWPEVNHIDLVRILLSYLGINLRETQLIQYAEMQKAKGV